MGLKLRDVQWVDMVANYRYNKRMSNENKPDGYNVRKVEDLKELSPEELRAVIGKLLNKLNLVVWTDTTRQKSWTTMRMPETQTAGYKRAFLVT